MPSTRRSSERSSCAAGSSRSRSSRSRDAEEKARLHAEADDALDDLRPSPTSSSAARSVPSCPDSRRPRTRSRRRRQLVAAALDADEPAELRDGGADADRDASATGARRRPAATRRRTVSRSTGRSRSPRCSSTASGRASTRWSATRRSSAASGSAARIGYATTASTSSSGSPAARTAALTSWPTSSSAHAAALHAASASLATNTITRATRARSGSTSSSRTAGRSIARSSPSRGRVKRPRDCEGVAVAASGHGKVVLERAHVRAGSRLAGPREPSLGQPERLHAAAGKSFIGSLVHGWASCSRPTRPGRSLTGTRCANAEVVCPYLNGEDLNSRARRISRSDG